jgi:uncharacterized membrane protein
MGFGFGFLNFIGTVLFIILLVWAMFLVRGGRGAPWRSSAAPYEDEALRTARERFASGEISAEELERLRQGLRAGETRESGHPMRIWFEGRGSALELARMRFAKGEVTLEEFEAIRKGLAG